MKSIKNYIIYESQESKSQEQAIKYAETGGMTHAEAVQFVRNKLRDVFPALKSKTTGKFTLGCTRIYNELKDNTDDIHIMNDILHLIDTSHYNEYDKNLNGLTFEKLKSLFLNKINNDNRIAYNKVSAKEYKNKGYDIIRINSFEEASEYMDDCYPIDEWCITYRKDMWNNYTDNGKNHVYFCLKHGYTEMDPPSHTTGYKDAYGTSMISVIVSPSGKLLYSTSRWNHSNGASGERDFTQEELSDIIGINFYKKFI